MALDIVVLNDNSSHYFDFNKFKSKYPHATLVDSSSASSNKNILNNVNTSQFWLVVGDQDNSFDFSSMPDAYDKQLKVKCFGSSFYLVNRLFFIKQVATKNIKTVSDLHQFDNLLIDSKCLDEMNDFDIIFLSYNETYAEQNFENLKRRFGDRVKHVNGIQGIVNAHFTAAEVANTDNFFVVDADAKVLDNFNFEYSLNQNEEDFVKVWYSKNPLNGLIYGYGGVKLFNKSMFKTIPSKIIDLTTSISSRGIHVIERVANITAFNSSPLETYRSAFRECAKLESRIIKNQIDIETEYRLNVWTSFAEGDFAEYCLAGAKHGQQLVLDNETQLDILELINDYEWLQNRFRSAFSL